MNRFFFLPFLCIAIVTSAACFYIPFLGVDETRYLAVAWDMKIYDSFLVPLLNASPYSHKPPLLFWLINLNWKIFGVNEVSIRFIPAIFSSLNLFLTYKISMELFSNKKKAEISVLILSSMILYIAWSFLVMFDILLTFWVLIAFYACIQPFEKWNCKFFCILAIATAGGLLTKGPVIFIYILFSGFSAFILHEKKRSLKWYLIFIMSVVAGIGLFMIWLLPAVFTGGEEYRNAVLWKQTAGRIISAFDHKRPFWWYLPLLPAITFPWFFNKTFLKTFSNIKENKIKFFLITITALFFITFSLISGKQIHYLIPILPFISILAADNFVNTEIHSKLSLKPVGIFFIFTSISFLIFRKLNYTFLWVDDISILNYIMVSVTFFAIGIFFCCFPPVSTEKFIKIFSLFPFIFIFVIIFMGRGVFQEFNLTEISLFLKNKQKAGYQIVYLGNYDGEFNFTGRLKKPLKIFKSKEKALSFIKNQNKSILVSYEKKEKPIPENTLIFKKKYKNGFFIVWSTDTAFQYFSNS